MPRLQLCNKGCGQQIYVAQTELGYRPFNANTEVMHDCPNYKKPAAPTTTTEIKPLPTTEQPMLKQNVGSGNSILLGLVQKIELYMETESTVLEKILERVMEKSTSSNVNSIANGVNIDKLSKRIDGLYDLEELNAAMLQQLKKHFKISTFQSASMFERAQHEEQPHNQEVNDEIADTDDQTQLDSHSINHVQQHQEE